MRTSVLESIGVTGLWFDHILIEWPVTDSHCWALTPLILTHKTSTSLSPTPQKRSKHLCCSWYKRKFYLLFFYSCLSEKACILPSAYEALSSVCFLGCWHCVQAFCFRFYDHIHVLWVLLPSHCPKDLPPVPWLMCKLLSPSPDIPSLKLSSQG